MHRSKIEWVLNPDNKTLGWVWNPITGCLNGCSYCYARKLAEGRLKQQYLANVNVPSIDTDKPLTLEQAGELQTRLENPFYPRFWQERMNDLPDVAVRVPWSKAKGIFVCDMSDLFGKGIPQKWTNQVLDRIRFYSEHRFYLLTKQPQNLGKFSSFPDNCWVGVTVDHQNILWKAAYYLSQIKASLKFISFEPLLVWNHPGCIIPVEDELRGINWVIIGAQTNPYQPPKLDWVLDIVLAADQANIPVFLKANLSPLLGNDLRQEMPKEGK